LKQREALEPRVVVEQVSDLCALATVSGEGNAIMRDATLIGLELLSPIFARPGADKVRGYFIAMRPFCAVRSERRRRLHFA
jgi:hypothetical protein